MRHTEYLMNIHLPSLSGEVPRGRWPTRRTLMSAVKSLGPVALLALAVMTGDERASANPPVPPAAPLITAGPPVLPPPSGFHFRTFQQITARDGSVVLVPIGSDGKPLSLQSPDFRGLDGKPVPIFRSVTTPTGSYLVVEAPPIGITPLPARTVPGISDLQSVARGEQGGHSGPSMPGMRSVIPVEAGQPAKGSVPALSPELPTQGGPLSEETLVGRWMSRDHTIGVTFHNKQEFNASAASVNFSRGNAQQVTLVEYRIDGKSNEVRFSRLGNAVAKPTNDGALLLSCELTFMDQKIVVTDRRLERCEP
jgi:hypothetical protein